MIMGRFHNFAVLIIVFIFIAIGLLGYSSASGPPGPTVPIALCQTACGSCMWPTICNLYPPRVLDTGPVNDPIDPANANKFAWTSLLESPTVPGFSLEDLICTAVPYQEVCYSQIWTTMGSSTQTFRNFESVMFDPNFDAANKQIDTSGNVIGWDVIVPVVDTCPPGGQGGWGPKLVTNYAFIHINAICAPGSFACRPYNAPASLCLSYPYNVIVTDQISCIPCGAGSPYISVNPTSFDFRTILVGTSSVLQTLSILNDGNGALAIYSLQITGTHYSEFSIQNDNCSGKVLMPSENCTVDLVFSPTSEGSKNANLSISSNDPDTPTLDVPLSGTGTWTEFEVSIDIKPGACPNPLNLVSKGFLPIAILGTAELDVTTIDHATIKLNRESVDCSVSPLRWSYEDVATPFEGELCDCHDLNDDGYMDLTLKFKNQEVMDCLELKDVAGETILLILTGNLKQEHGDTPIRGEDCIRSMFKCYLSPDTIVIPRGGTLGFQATVTNYTSGTGRVLFATDVTMPNGNKSGYLIGPVGIVLTPNGSRSKHVSQFIPNYAPPGIYTYHGYIGNVGEGIYHECTFEFEVTQ